MRMSLRFFAASSSSSVSIDRISSLSKMMLLHSSSRCGQSLRTRCRQPKRCLRSPFSPTHIAACIMTSNFPKISSFAGPAAQMSFRMTALDMISSGVASLTSCLMPPSSPWPSMSTKASFGVLDFARLSNCDRATKSGEIHTPFVKLLAWLDTPKTGWSTRAFIKYDLPVRTFPHIITVLMSPRSFLSTSVAFEVISRCEPLPNFSHSKLELTRISPEEPESACSGGCRSSSWPSPPPALEPIIHIWTIQLKSFQRIGWLQRWESQK
mmetsp:Transcript_111082/g.201897  ORF Transcript_111082/g.201897 Transcript_111082/m.201897 type:complete len:267 (-) Transcript_111082:2-802(-)